MDRTTAVTVWREVCGTDSVMILPPTGRTLEEFARRIAEAERERICAAIKAEDDHCATGDYMLGSDDRISVVQGE